METAKPRPEPIRRLPPRTPWLVACLRATAQASDKPSAIGRPSALIEFAASCQRRGLPKSSTPSPSRPRAAAVGQRRCCLAARRQPASRHGALERLADQAAGVCLRPAAGSRKRSERGPQTFPPCFSPSPSARRCGCRPALRVLSQGSWSWQQGLGCGALAAACSRSSWLVATAVPLLAHLLHALALWLQSSPSATSSGKASGKP